MEFSERLKQIKNKIDFLKTHDKSYKPIRYTFKETIEIKKIKEFEQKYNVTLPEEYVEFITTLGVGVCSGCGIFPPDYTLKLVGKSIETESELCESFPFNNDDVKAIIEKDISDRNYFGEDIYSIQGCLLVDEDELGYASVLLVLNGEQKGKVWKWDEYGRLTPFYKITSYGYDQMSFLDLYEDWVEYIFKWLKYDPDEEPENLKDIKYLSFKGNNLTQIPTYTFKCGKLEKLYISNTNIEKISEEIVKLKNLEYLGIEHSEVSALPEKIDQLKKLKYLHMLKNNIISMPESLFTMNSLEILDLRCNKLTNIPEAIDKLKALKELELYENSLKELPNSIGNILTLEKLHIGNNDICSLPKSISQLYRLKNLEIYGNKRLKVSSILPILYSLKSLEQLTVSEIQIDTSLKLNNVNITTIVG